MTGRDGKKNPGQDKTRARDGREARLAAQLRANLKRRKAKKPASGTSGQRSRQDSQGSGD